MTMLLTPNRITNPFTRGSRVLIPAGTPLRSMHPRRKGGYLSKRTQTITVHHSSDGHIDLWNDHRNGFGYVILPVATWPGAGGYWIDVKVTPELCVLNLALVPELPVMSEYDRDRLDVEPAYGPGYDDRDA